MVHVAFVILCLLWENKQGEFQSLPWTRVLQALLRSRLPQRPLDFCTKTLSCSATSSPAKLHWTDLLPQLWPKPGWSWNRDCYQGSRNPYISRSPLNTAINTSNSFCHGNTRQHHPLSRFGHGPFCLCIKYTPPAYHWNSRQAFFPPWFSLGNIKLSIQGALLKVGYLPMKVRVHICADNSDGVSTVLPVLKKNNKKYL